MFSEPGKTLEELNLSKYEILNNEPLNDVSNHIKNLYSQIPFNFKQKNNLCPKSIHHSKIKLQESLLITERVCCMSATG